MGFGAANIQSQKERLMKIVKKESNLRKSDSHAKLIKKMRNELAIDVMF